MGRVNNKIENNALNEILGVYGKRATKHKLIANLTLIFGIIILMILGYLFVYPESLIRLFNPVEICKSIKSVFFG